MSRQNYYARRRQRRRRQVDGELVAGLVQRERRLPPRLGTRKLHHLLKLELEEAGVRIGRDRMFEELRKRGLLLARLPTPYPCTTQSYHNLPVFGNLTKEVVPEGRTAASLPAPQSPPELVAGPAARPAEINHPPGSAASSPPSDASARIERNLYLLRQMARHEKPC